MQNLLFFSRMAFICNICFVLAWLLRMAPELPSGHILSVILILGLLVAVLLNGTVHIFMIIFLLQGRPVWNHFPRWLIIINFLFLLPQLILFVQ